MFGLENIGKGSVEEAHATVNDLVLRLDPLLRDVENRLGGILHGLLDRVEIDIKVSIKPIPKAEKVET